MAYVSAVSPHGFASRKRLRPSLLVVVIAFALAIVGCDGEPLPDAQSSRDASRSSTAPGVEATGAADDAVPHSQSQLSSTTTPSTREINAAVPAPSEVPAPTTSSVAPAVVTTEPDALTSTTSGPLAPATRPRAPATTTNAITPSAARPRRGLGIEDGRLVVDGQLRALVGVNAPGAASVRRLGSPCGSADVDLDLMFSLLPDRSLVRVWFTQRTATDLGATVRDWGPLDAVVAAAERSTKHPILVVTLATNSGACDGGRWRNRAWYDGGYRTDPEPAQPRTYFAWVESVVSRYADRDVIGAWEPVNEPNPTTCVPGYEGTNCYGHTSCSAGAAQSLRAFFDAVGNRIHRLDRKTLVSTGGAGSCGWASPQESAFVESSPYLDVVSLHDYAPGIAVPDAVVAAVARARMLGKPVLIGELGMPAAPAQVEWRAEALVRRAAATTRSGVDGVVFWTFGYGVGCDLCLMPDDPIYALLGTARFSSGY